MKITAAMVKELRERTGSGMMECKKALVQSNLAKIDHRFIEHRQRFFQIDDMDSTSCPKYIRGHFGIPVTGLMTEMNASL